LISLKRRVEKPKKKEREIKFFIAWFLKDVLQKKKLKNFDKQVIK